MSINPFDEIALEEALRIKERGAAEEVIAVTSAGRLPSSSCARRSPWAPIAHCTCRPRRRSSRWRRPRVLLKLVET